MSSIRETTDRDRITVKIHNMKRSPSRDTPPKMKRGRVSIGRYEEAIDDRISPDRGMRRRMARSPSPRPRYVSPHREEYMRVPRELPPDRSHSYKVLCVSGLHPKSSDEFIKDTLYREYKKFGDFSIRIAHDLDERVAYVCFRMPDDARDAKHAKPRIMMYDKMAVVEPVYETSRPAEYKYKHRSLTPPEYDRGYYPPPAVASAERRRPPPPIDPYDRYAIPPHAPIHHPRDYRPPIHHEYIPRNPPIHHHHHGPPMHHGPPPHHHHNHHQYHYSPRNMQNRHNNHNNNNHNNHDGGGSSKKEKFPNYLHHISPEEDARSTRTLFAGNLEINISDEELARIFGKYGVVEDIDIKRPPPGTGNAYAFIRFQNLDMAHRAKLELSGQYIGKFQCKIGYGKATPATRIWVGGLGSWTTVALLEREFDRFGAIKKIDFVKAENCAYIVYESIEAAQEAVKEMRGFPLGGSDTRLRTDFAELPTGNNVNKPKTGYDENEYRRHEYGYYDGGYDGGYNPSARSGGYRGRGGPGGGGRGSDFRGRHSYRNNYEPQKPGTDEEYRRGGGGAGGLGGNNEPGEYEPRPRRSPSREGVADRSRSRSRHRTPDTDSDTSSRRAGILSAARTLPEVARKATTQWTGALILKSSLFPAKLHLTDGDGDIVNSLMKSEDGKQNLRITQRLRLDPPKLDDVHKRIASSTSHAIFLGMPGSTSTVYVDDAAIQTRPLRNLVSYLKQKEAAGVLPLLNKSTETTGVLYAFPPCDFSSELLKKTCHNITEDALKEDHLLVVVVRGGPAQET